mmetsp:Transcript_99203/g.309197  ORF Transcript_99203/g.309197 Transcript_99203/m.309197 type:complete len:216 (-) Transcript_99203:62-709(-)
MSSARSVACLFLALGLSQALKLQEAGDCTCLAWADVYASGSSVSCAAGLGDGFGGGEFCGFIEKLRDNFCLHDKFQAEQKTLAGSKCFVKAACQGAQSLEAFGVKDLSVKACTKESGDRLLVEMPIAEHAKIAKDLGVDQGVMAGYASVRIDKLTKNVSGEELAGVKASGVPTLIWSMEDHFADRWLVKGNEVWVHKFSPSTPGFWAVSCKEGCA